MEKLIWGDLYITYKSVDRLIDRWRVRKDSGMGHSRNSTNESGFLIKCEDRINSVRIGMKQWML